MKSIRKEIAQDKQNATDKGFDAFVRAAMSTGKPPASAKKTTTKKRKVKNGPKNT